jgi:uncharacterized ubiquitin-like protein YukD
MANGNTLTTEEIVSRIHSKFPEYDCSKVVYTRNKKPITIICPIHGEFIRGHSKGYECQKCCLERRTIAQTGTAEDFILRSKAIHGDKYDYSLVEYTTARKDVKIICNTHKTVFEQKADIHVHGKGCPLCKNDKLANDRRADKEHFVKRAVATHGDKYEYDKVVYNNAKTKVIITCPLHGDFPSYPDNHWSGTGCPDCSEAGFSCNRPASLYVLQYANVTKIGITNTQVAKRNKAMSKSYGKPFKLLAQFSHDNGLLISDTETTMINELRQIYNQPIDRFPGYSECFFDVDLAFLLNSLQDKLGVRNGC